MFSLTQKWNVLRTQHSFIIARDLLNKLPYRWFRIGRFYVLHLSSLPSLKFRSAGTVEKGSLTDVDEMCMLENKKTTFKQRLADGDSCLVARNQGRLVGYLWYTVKSSYLETRFNYSQHVPDNSLFGYDCYVSPEYRLRGTWALLQKQMFEEAQRIGRTKIITHIDFGNTLSIKSHIRFGYEARERITAIRIGSKCVAFARDTSGEEV